MGFLDIFSKKIEMLLISDGSFFMGSDDVWGTNMVEELKNAWMPKHEVYLDAFWIDIFLITNKHYMQFVKETSHNDPISYKSLKKNISGLPASQNTSLPIIGLQTLIKPNHPVVGVSWYDAIAFCKWRSEKEKQSFKLPTEAQWEKAARGGLAGAKYPWGNNWDAKRCNTFERVEMYPFNLRADKATTPVNKYPVNAYGLYDMYGNVEQWCRDWYNKNYYKNSPKKNPDGPSNGEKKVVRGIEYESYGQSYRIEGRGCDKPNDVTLTRGFRCVREID